MHVCIHFDICSISVYMCWICILTICLCITYEHVVYIHVCTHLGERLIVISHICACAWVGSMWVHMCRLVTYMYVCRHVGIVTKIMYVWMRRCRQTVPFRIFFAKFLKSLFFFFFWFEGRGCSSFKRQAKQMPIQLVRCSLCSADLFCSCSHGSLRRGSWRMQRVWGMFVRWC